MTTIKKRRIPVIIYFLLVVVILFFLLTGMILSQIKAIPKKPVDYMIILGARVRESQITKSLRFRLDTAYDYLVKNVETIAIVSGGQGADENLSEAEAMQQYLIEKGIDKNRILLEDRSTNTRENIRFSKALIPKSQRENPKTGIAVVTNNFHVYRAIAIGQRQGLKEIEGLAAPSDRLLFPNLMLREVLALGKDILLGNAKPLIY